MIYFLACILFQTIVYFSFLIKKYGNLQKDDKFIRVLIQVFDIFLLDIFFETIVHFSFLIKKCGNLQKNDQFKEVLIQVLDDLIKNCELFSPIFRQENTGRPSFLKCTGSRRRVRDENPRGSRSRCFVNRSTTSSTARALRFVTMPRLSPSLSFSLVGWSDSPRFSLEPGLRNSACPSVDRRRPRSRRTYRALHPFAVGTRDFRKGLLPLLSRTLPDSVLVPLRYVPHLAERKARRALFPRVVSLQ